ncbi:MAG: YihY/virulence factor BrkB family protein [Nitrospirota bacterium]
MKYLKIIFKSLLDFLKDGGIILAGSISYFSMTAILPLCLFLVTIFGYIIGQHEGFYKFLSGRLIHFFPEITSEITTQLGKLIAFKGIGIISLVLYVILSFPVFSSIENALNIIFKVKQKRHFFWSIMLSLVIIALIMFILFVSFTATSFIPILKTLKPVFPELRIGLITGFLIRYIVPFFMVLFTATIMYIFLPKTKVRISHAFTGALFTAIFLEIAKHIFTWYVGNVAQFGTIYGPLSAFIMFLLWVYYSSCVFLIGAEIVYNQGISKK